MRGKRLAMALAMTMACAASAATAPPLQERSASAGALKIDKARIDAAM